MNTKKLNQLSACVEAIEYVKTQKSAKDAWNNCIRGDWMLWLAKKLNVDDRKLTLAKAMCAKQVKHLMKDQRSLDALDACFRYAKDKISRGELNTYALAALDAYAAYDAYDANAADAAANASAAYAAYDANAADAAANADAAAYAAFDANVAANADTAHKESLKKSADICRAVLTEEVLKKYIEYNAKK